MVSAKTAAPCEVCGKRVKHHGPQRGFTVGYTAKSVPRLVHNSCKGSWKEQGAATRQRWPELRPDVFPSLPAWLQQRIQQFHTEGVMAMPRGRASERFPFGANVEKRIRETLSTTGRRKGVIKRLLEVLQQDMPTKVPAPDDEHGYTDFYQFFHEVEAQMKAERLSPPQELPAPIPVPPAMEHVPPARPEPLTAAPPATSSFAATDDLDMMVRIAHALIDLALLRRRRDVIELAFMGLEDLLKPHKSDKPAGSS